MGFEGLDNSIVKKTIENSNVIKEAYGEQIKGMEEENAMLANREGAHARGLEELSKIESVSDGEKAETKEAILNEIDENYTKQKVNNISSEWRKNDIKHAEEEVQQYIGLTEEEAQRKYRERNG